MRSTVLSICCVYLVGGGLLTTVNLPGIVAHTSMDAESVALLREHLTAFLAFLAREQKRLFVDAYETPSLAYQRQGAL